jgi:hypothetical protein
VYNVVDGTFFPSELTVDSEEKQVAFATLYTQPPDDELKMGPKHVKAM